MTIAKKISCWSGVAGCILLSFSATAQSRFSYSTQGAEVIDSQTGLIWRRCSEGQSWDGSTCTGSASGFTHEGALVHARSQEGWRLPNVKELSSIVDKTRVVPAIDVTAFPATSPSHYWSSSPNVGDASYAWNISFRYGFVDTLSFNRNSGLFLRLVR